MRRHSRCAALSVAAIATALLAMPVASVQAQDLIWARYGDIDSLDPHRATSTLSMQIWDQIFDTLLAFDMDGTPRPNMAASWEESEDGLSYTFTLNEGILCHDGSPFTAEDVKFTVDRAFAPDSASLTQTA
jgi:peptide/nickel transport system substrate-binding protein